MLRYEDYLDRCWFLNAGVASTDFIRSQFDFGTRQRRALRGYDNVGFRLIVGWGELIRFKTFWLDLNMGTEKFTTDQPIFGDPTKNKTVRFTSGYNLKELSYRRWEITGTVEIISTTINDDWLKDQCPRIPHVGFVPNAPVFPCGTP